MVMAMGREGFRGEWDPVLKFHIRRSLCYHPAHEIIWMERGNFPGINSGREVPKTIFDCGGQGVCGQPGGRSGRLDFEPLCRGLPRVDRCLYRQPLQYGRSSLVICWIVMGTSLSPDEDANFSENLTGWLDRLDSRPSSYCDESSIPYLPAARPAAFSLDKTTSSC